MRKILLEEIEEDACVICRPIMIAEGGRNIQNFVSSLSGQLLEEDGLICECTMPRPAMQCRRPMQHDPSTRPCKVVHISEGIVLGHPIWLCIDLLLLLADMLHGAGIHHRMARAQDRT